MGLCSVFARAATLQLQHHSRKIKTRSKADSLQLLAREMGRFLCRNNEDAQNLRAR